MSDRKEAARHRYHGDTRQMSRVGGGHVDYTRRDYERGAAFAGLSTVVMLGMCMLHWAVM